MELNTGVYETLIYKALQEKLSKLDPATYKIGKGAIDLAESPKLLSNYLSKILNRILSDDE